MPKQTSSRELIHEPLLVEAAPGFDPPQPLTEDTAQTGQRNQRSRRYGWGVGGAEPLEARPLVEPSRPASAPFLGAGPHDRTDDAPHRGRRRRRHWLDHPRRPLVTRLACAPRDWPPAHWHPLARALLETQ